MRNRKGLAGALRYPLCGHVWTQRAEYIVKEHEKKIISTYLIG